MEQGNISFSANPRNFMLLSLSYVPKQLTKDPLLLLVKQNSGALKALKNPTIVLFLYLLAGLREYGCRCLKGEDLLAYSAFFLLQALAFSATFCFIWLVLWGMLDWIDPERVE